MKQFSLGIIVSACFGLQAQPCALLCNGGFDDNSITTSATLVNSLTCWQTTASDGKMEVWGSGYTGVTSYNGIQHVELNATEAATMFQDINVTSPVSLSISFAHRGRSGIDTVEISAGPSSGPFTSLGRFGDNNQVWGTYTVNYVASTPGMFQIRFTPVYWTGGNHAIGNFLDGVSIEGTAILQISPPATTVCAGSQLLLTATGASSYSWTGGPATATWQVVPSTNTGYTVTGTNSQGCAGAASITVYVQPCTDIPAFEKSTSVSVFPNPASGSLRLIAAGPQQVHFFNALGEKIASFECSTGENVINTANFARGVYFIVQEQAGKVQRLVLVE